jgi:hypothetical protein
VLVLLTLSLSINFVGQALRRAADSRQRRGWVWRLFSENYWRDT